MAHSEIDLLKQVQLLFNRGRFAEGNEVLERAIERLEVLLEVDPPLSDPRLERLRIMALRQQQAFESRRL